MLRVIRMDSQDEMIKRTLEIISHAGDDNVVLRIVGGCAIHLHCPSLSHVHTDVLGRRFGDLDFVGSSNQIRQIINLFGKFGYTF